MTLVNNIDAVVAWLDEHVCQQVMLKLPLDDNNDSSYGVEYVNPTAFPLYVPGKNLLPPKIKAPIPSICVQIMEGNDDLLNRRRSLKVRLCLACWNPGTHGDEILHPKENPEATHGVSYTQEDKGEAQTYARDMEGWRDSFNFLDLVLRELEGAEYINGLRLVKESDIKYGLFEEDGDITTYYPYWHSWVSFTLEAGVVIKKRPYEDLL